MIVIGYYGLGKSSVCSENPGFIDLESKYFREEGSWLGGNSKVGLDRYIWLIEDLNAAGKTVFVSSLKEVRKAIFESKKIDSFLEVAYIYPDLNLKDEWLSRLYNRWKESSLQKDWLAYERATREYPTVIKEMKEEKGNLLDYVITKDNIEDFDLKKAVLELEDILDMRKEDE